ncbi:MAG: cobalamin-binding protein [Clostridia bacterium]|nr:cobalamin-binding protein [Clostridia bacterium]
MNALVKYMSALDVNSAKAEVKRLLEQNVHQTEVFQMLLEGLAEIGKKYEAGEFYIGDLIVAGMLMKDILSMEEMKSMEKEQPKIQGKVVIGTVLEDIHDIGKGIIADMLAAIGFEVIDLGVDVSPERFAEAVLEHKPQIVGISCVLTTAINNIFTTIKAIEQTGLRHNLKIIVGGAALDNRYFSIKEADAFTNDAYEGVQICEDWMKDMNA